MPPTDAAIFKKMYGSGAKSLLFSNNKLNDLMKIIKDLEDHNILLKRNTNYKK